MWRRYLALGLVPLLLLVAIGCKTVRGGGSIPSADGRGTARFGFQMVCNQDNQEVSGQFEYHDPSAGVRFHGVVDRAPFGCHRRATWGVFAGTYRAQPPESGEDGFFLVMAGDDVRLGRTRGDHLCIMLFGGAFDGYQNFGDLTGGNIVAE